MVLSATYLLSGAFARHPLKSGRGTGIGHHWVGPSVDCDMARHDSQDHIFPVRLRVVALARGFPFAWDTARLVRVGQYLAPVDWTDEWAGAMAGVLEAHRFRFHAFTRCDEDERRLRALLGDVELLVGVTERALAQIRRCLARACCPDPLCLGVDAVYEAAFGHPLGRLGAFVASNGWTSWPGVARGCPSALRVVSWVGAVLSMRAGRALVLFDLALDGARGELGIGADEEGPGWEACGLRALDPR